MNKWQSFVTLRWYDGLIEFVFRFVAKTSEPLLALGLVFSAADVLTKGRLMQSNLALTDLWAWTQAIAIESSGGVVLVYALQSFREHDKIKGYLYLVLSSLLAIVGGMMLYSQLLSNATGAADAFSVGTAWQVQTLVILRVIVSVGYVVMCRTKHIRFNDLQESAPIQAVVAVPQVIMPNLEEILDRIDARNQQRMQAILERTVETVRLTITEQTNPNMLAINPPKQPVGGEHAQRGIDALLQDDGGEQNLSYGDAIETLLKEHPGLTIREISEHVGCSLSTANKWVQRLKVPTNGANGHLIQD